VQNILHDAHIQRAAHKYAQYMATAKPPNLPETGWIEVSRVKIDERYQHKPYTWAAARLQEGFNPDWSGFICVNVRKNEPDVYYVIDGYTRNRVHEIRQYRWMRAEIYRGLTVEQEAEFYLIRAINIQRTPIDMFAAECTAGRKDAILLRDILTQRHITWQQYAEPAIPTHAVHKITCIKALRRLLAMDDIEKDRGGVHLTAALDLILDTWPDDVRALNKTVITSMFYFVKEHRRAYDRRGFIDRLSQYSIEDIQEGAQRLRLATEIKPTLYNAFKSKVIELYNINRSADRRLK